MGDLSHLLHQGHLVNISLTGVYRQSPTLGCQSSIHDVDWINMKLYNTVWAASEMIDVTNQQSPSTVHPHPHHQQQQQQHELLTPTKSARHIDELRLQHNVVKPFKSPRRKWFALQLRLLWTNTKRHRFVTYLCNYHRSLVGLTTEKPKLVSIVMLRLLMFNAVERQEGKCRQTLQVPLHKLSTLKWLLHWQTLHHL